MQTAEAMFSAISSNMESGFQILDCNLIAYMHVVPITE